VAALAAISCPGPRSSDAGVQRGGGAVLEGPAAPAYAPPPATSLHDDDWDAPLS
jgi:hypothetical protein